MLYFCFAFLFVCMRCTEALRLNRVSDVNTDLRQVKPINSMQKLKIIYVNAFARSMSSTMQKFLETLDPSTFCLFEPCHGQDETQYGNLGEENTAARCISDVLNCDFSKIQLLVHTPGFKNHKSEYIKKCLASSTRNFKTVTVHNLTNVIDMINSHPQELNVVHILRDPRSILASQKSTFHMTLTEELIAEVCRFHSNNLAVSHQKIHKVHFHEIVNDPMSAFKKLTQDMGFSFLDSQKDFVSANFNNPSCKDEAYSTCRKNSKSRIRKWEKDLSDKEKLIFANNDECMKVIRTYYGDDHSGFLKQFPL